ncbi:GGDEF domain-containing protein [Streptomyces sp. NBC_01497]|uniref:GGDEF domain-containing protein n=1 Tax=Streptomyces sp. NBC_01497 TaxID=2903885 RepID=UPI002E34B403|nr:GGDEF domain-containing protein [Streptomyces sp. NBC_01497]
MSSTVTTLAAALPLAAGWSLHGWRLRRRIEAARRDPLTGLPTRDAFTSRAGRLLAAGRSAVYLLDLDHFKQINDTFGHAAGDVVIRATGERLAAWADETGAAVARLGGDEFAAVDLCYGKADLLWSLDRLTHTLTAPMALEGHTLVPQASIGAVLADPHDAADLPLLLRLADEQMYVSKSTRKPWSIADDLSPVLPSANGRRAGRTGTHDWGQQ